MSTEVLRSYDAHHRVNQLSAARRNEHYFFLGMTALILAAVFTGFAKTYYMAGVFHAPLPNPLIHVHGAAFTLWLLVLVMQTSLVAAGRVDLHRQLGVAGFALACLMVLLGVAAATDLLRRDSNVSVFHAQSFYAGTMGDMVIFAALTYFAFRLRRDPASHKRLILIATLTFMEAAVIRWSFATTLIEHRPFMLAVLSHCFLIPLIVYDLWTRRTLHPATLWGGLFLVVGQWLQTPIGNTATWQSFAGWVLGHVGTTATTGQ